MESVNLVVVGAGWYGLAAAKTYIELHQDERILVLDSASSVGGVWSSERLYPGLKSNNMLGTYEYSDFPMDTATYGVRPGEHIPASTIHRYLTAYAEHFGLLSRMRFDTRVNAAEEKEGAWILDIHNTVTGERTQLKTDKLVIATGLTSEPHVPTIDGQEDFKGPIFHSKDFAAHAGLEKKVRSVAVLGGAKSAWDAAYTYAAADVSVEMIIRTNGRGPTWMVPPYVTPMKKWLEKLVHTRFLQWFSPCVWGDEDGYESIRRFLHGTWFGRKIVDTFWSILCADAIQKAGYDNHEETKKLKPWNSAFWIGSGLSILNFPTDFLQLVRDGKIRVHLADVTSLSSTSVHLSNGQSIEVDALLCATGWKSSPPINFLPTERLAELGMPYCPSQPVPLLENADAEILARFPRLKDQPEIASSATEQGEKRSNQPFCLYRFLTPPAVLEKQNIAFAGMTSTVSTPIVAQTQALWISAFFDGKLDRLPPREQAQWEAVLHNRFGKWRYPCGYGDRLPDFVFDALPYVDMLLRDLGVKSHRKSGRLADMFEPYGPEDYKGLVSEWAENHIVRTP
ncbi:dimethylaniline monooxygenase (N-oxide forming) [Ampelomyces quisqualis]|uniref:Dimethylaniline monooxygenase (N-oxide forming) n=1 Tax=Ampelomyces quisqualis TaxID=50730 RepID=A0A6A5QAH8_AMPQU|nr:dimethylaniline monooxygenase (N-oxide forming) [Ampelomyces quisqualis]